MSGGAGVYLAAPYGAREVIRQYAADLRALGLMVTSSWLDETHDINSGTQAAATSLSDEVVSAHARQDMADIDRSDMLVLFTAASVGIEGGGGRHIETGYALALGMPLIIVGEPENVFHRLGLPRVRLTPDWPAALAYLEDAS